MELATIRRRRYCAAHRGQTAAPTTHCHRESEWVLTFAGPQDDPQPPQTHLYVDDVAAAHGAGPPGQTRLGHAAVVRWLWLGRERPTPVVPELPVDWPLVPQLSAARALDAAAAADEWEVPPQHCVRPSHPPAGAGMWVSDYVHNILLHCGTQLQRRSPMRENGPFSKGEAGPDIVARQSTFNDTDLSSPQ